MKPKPWSHSALEAFKNCPRSYYEHRIARSVVETKGPATVYGERVHKDFEDMMRDGIALPLDLQMHEDYLLRLKAMPGIEMIEEKIAFNTKVLPCEYFAPDVWYRGVIDYGKVDGERAHLVDYKTGKMHSKLGQLYLFMLWTFARYPQVQVISAEYYWTQLRTTNGAEYPRSRIHEMWKQFAPDLKQYAEAFVTDIWQPRQSGLCKRHCAVKDCEFNGLGLRR